MIVVDTCIWIEFLKGKEPYFSNLSELLEQGQVLGLELIFAELMQGAKNKREREFISNYWNYLPKFSIRSCSTDCSCRVSLTVPLTSVLLLNGNCIFDTDFLC